MKNRPKDYGSWIFDNQLQEWVEDEHLSQAQYLEYGNRRDISATTEVIFYIDGFPSQGNSSLRHILLETLYKC